MGEAEILDRLFRVIEARRLERPEGSYVVELLDGGLEAIAAKVREEADETIEAAAGRDGRLSRCVGVRRKRCRRGPGA